MPADRRPYYALVTLALALAVALALPASRAWLAESVAAPLQAQADPAHATGNAGYTVPSLAFWAIVGVVLAWVAYDLVFRRLGHEPDRAFFVALAPWLVAAPLAHALLAVGRLPLPWAYLATEPPIYLTTAVLLVAALVLSRSLRRTAIVGGVVLALLAVVALPRASAAGAARASLLLALAAVSAAVLAVAYVRLAKPRHDALTIGLVIGAHALDGATTWISVNHLFGFPGSFEEKNPVSLTLLDIGNGWPYFALKLALPLVLLSLVKVEEGERRQEAFLLFAVFVLGYGPGMANLLQVLLA